MKKLLVLMMVAAIASVATAALSLDVEVGGSDYAGEILAVGTTVTVKVVQSAPNGNGQGGVISIGYAGTGGTKIEGTPTLVFVAPFTGWQWFINGIDDSVAGAVKATKIPNLPVGGGPPIGTPGIGSDMSALGAGVPYEFTFGATFDTTVTHNVALTGSWDGSAVSLTELINVIPEPMTMALLGLGGLFLRRRR